MNASRWLPCALILAACGARSGLEAEPAPERDAGFNFATFPCRWSVGIPVTVAVSRGPGAGFEGLSGGTVGDRASVLGRAAVTATDLASGEHVGGVVSTAGRAELLVPFNLMIPVTLYAGVDGFVAHPAPTCQLGLFSIDFAGPLAEVAIGDPAAGCRVSQTVPEALDVARSEVLGMPTRVLRAETRGGGVTTRPLTLARTPAERIDVVHQPEHGTMLLAVGGGEAFVERHVGDAVNLHGPIALGGPISAAAERLRGGLVVLRRAPDRWVLERYPYEAPLAPIELLDLSELPAEPIGRLASNETEALLPLADGSMAYVALANPILRRVDMEDVPRVSAMEIVVRPGDSSGGLLYAAEVRGGVELAFRPLTCNR